MTDNNKITDRRQLLDELLNLIAEAIKKANSHQYRGQSHKIRNDYYRSVSTLVNSFARLSRDTELDELACELEKLKEDLKK